MIFSLLSALFLYIFSILNILGIRKNLAINQLAFALVAGLSYIAIKKIGRPFFKRNAHLFYWFFVFTLLVTFFIGIEVKGSRRWITFFFFNFQGSEFFKIFFVLFLSEFLSKTHKSISDLRLFLLSLFYFIIPTFIIFKQPDLGNAMVFFFIYFVMLLFSQFSKKYFFYTLGCIVAMLPFGWFFLKGYQRERIFSFINPHLDQQGTSYNMAQAIITVGSGQFLGHGLGLGTQSRLLFLPENQTDFAFSSLVEQFGFLGGFVVILLFIFIIATLVRKLLKFYSQKDEDERSAFLFTVGIFAYFFFQIAINIGMNLGLFPVTGIALPFISYGGSALVAIAIGFALLP